MKAILFREYGDPSVLQFVEDAAVPELGPGQVLVRVAGTSFNGIDGNIRAGFMQEQMPLTLPHIPGLDVAGTITATGPDVDGFTTGDAVVGFLPFTVDGASAEFVVAAADGLTRAPKSIPLADAAALPLVGLTAYQALFDHAKLTSGQRILVNGASGAVGGYAVQLAKAAGAHVVATTTADGAERLTARGADEVIDYGTTPVSAQVDEPVDVLLNLAPIDPAEYQALAAHVRDGGVVVGTTVWMPTPGDDARGVRGIDLFVNNDPGQLAELVGRVERGELIVDIGQRVPLQGLADVHRAAADGNLPGKVVIDVDPS